MKHRHTWCNECAEPYREHCFMRREKGCWCVELFRWDFGDSLYQCGNFKQIKYLPPALPRESIYPWAEECEEALYIG